MQICKDNRFLPESFFQKYKSTDSLLSDSIQNCGAIMDIVRESALPEPEPIRSGIVSAIFGKSASVPAVPVNLNCEATPELLREHPAREWQELCRKFPQTNVPLAVKEFPWLRRVNSRRFRKLPINWESMSNMFYFPKFLRSFVTKGLDTPDFC